MFLDISFTGRLYIIIAIPTGLVWHQKGCLYFRRRGYKVPNNQRTLLCCLWTAAPDICVAITARTHSPSKTTIILDLSNSTATHDFDLKSIDWARRIGASSPYTGVTTVRNYLSVHTQTDRHADML